MALILHPVHYAYGIFYASHTKVDASLSSGPLVETGYHVSNIAFSEVETIVECLHSAFIVDAVAVALRAETDTSKGLVHLVMYRRN